MKFFSSNKSIETALSLIRNKINPTLTEIAFEIAKGTVIAVGIHFVSEIVIGKIEGETEEETTTE